MSGLNRSSDGLDSRRKRILFRSWHRGTKEMDLLLGGYVEAHIADLQDDELDRLEHLMDAEDADLLDWLTGRKPAPAEYDTDIFRAVYEFHGGDITPN
ncbi:succinate dehydrogenase assembly factor 2 [Breoghania sp.]|uniref:FAD assembly factor SdhE n=1 Tax=Breoghania sp. TaxID=2065378 RepID=UPI002635ADE3|nr:succinate dehydrogenase assembly factor 2 [Breoghania sp.]MDJ0929647.1 succinate dehydrogenase assembly factor 2 [Breoghania sp.]